MQPRIFVHGCRFFTRALFSHVGPLIARGKTRPLEIEDMPALPKQFDPREGFRLFEGLSTLHMNVSHGDKVPLRSTLALIGDVVWRVRKPALMMSLLSFAGVICELLAPVLIHELLTLSLGCPYHDTILKFDNLIAVCNGCQPVCNNQDCSTEKLSANRILYPSIRFDVNA